MNNSNFSVFRGKIIISGFLGAFCFVIAQDPVWSRTVQAPASNAGVLKDTPRDAGQAASHITSSQTEQANPLEVRINKNDPLIPNSYGKRELSSFEKYRIEKTIPELDRSAKAELEKGNVDRAFKLWYRQLKLTRVLGTAKEIEALGEVGAIAWQENRGIDVRNIAERLTTVRQEATEQKTLSAELLHKFAIAYQQVRYLDKATDIYQQILVNSRKKDDLVAIRENLATLGELYLARFNYQKAAEVYQELLALSEGESKPNKQTTYLNTLVDLYDRTAQSDRAIAARKRLINQYDDTQLDLIADLEIAIARDYQTLNQTDEAIEAYNQAFVTASQTQRLATKADALTELGELYQAGERVDEAIATYNKLLEVQQQTYNDYGLINTYDTLGKMYSKLGQKTQAKQSFRLGLELAKSLNYKVEYFNNQIQHSNK